MEDEVAIKSILGETKGTTAAFTWIVPEVSKRQQKVLQKVVDTVMVEHVRLFQSEDEKDLALPRVTKVLKKFL